MTLSQLNRKPVKLIEMLEIMCDYTVYRKKCGHYLYLVKAWCLRYQQNHKRCPPNVIEFNVDSQDKCGRLLNHSKILDYCTNGVLYSGGCKRKDEVKLWQAKKKKTRDRHEQEV